VFSIFVGIPFQLIGKKILLSKVQVISYSAVVCLIMSSIFALTGLIEKKGLLFHC